MIAGHSQGFSSEVSRAFQTLRGKPTNEAAFSFSEFFILWTSIRIFCDTAVNELHCKITLSFTLSFLQERNEPCRPAGCVRDDSVELGIRGRSDISQDTSFETSIQTELLLNETLVTPQRPLHRLPLIINIFKDLKIQ